MRARRRLRKRPRWSSPTRAPSDDALIAAAGDVLMRSMRAHMAEDRAHAAHARAAFAHFRLTLAEHEQKMDESAQRLEQAMRARRRRVVKSEIERLHRRLAARHPRAVIAGSRAALGPLEVRLAGPPG